VFTRALQEVYIKRLEYRHGVNKLIAEAKAAKAAVDAQAPAADKLNDEQEAKLVELVQNKIIIAKMILNQKAPEAYYVISGLNIKIVNSNDRYVGTMAVDPYGNIYVNSKFGAGLTDDEFYAVFAHEALHHLNRTFYRKGNRDHTLWNIATDALMNWGLDGEGYKLPKNGIIPNHQTGEFVFPDLKNLGLKKPSINVLDKNGVVLSCEEIYEQLEQLAKEVQKKFDKNQSKPGQGQPAPCKGEPGPSQCKTGQGSGQGNFPTPGKPGKGDLIPGEEPGNGGKPGQGKNKPGQGKGEPGKDKDEPGLPGQGKPGQGKAKPGDSNEPGSPGSDGPGGPPSKEYTGNWRDYFEKLDNKTDTHLTAEQAAEVNKDTEAVMTPEDMKRREREIIDQIRRGQLDVADNPGSVGRGTEGGGGYIRKIINQSLPMIVDWREPIKRYLKAAQNKVTRSWLKPSYKGLAGGYQAPGRIKANSPKLVAIFALDTSGSVGDIEFGLALSYVKQIADTVSDLDVKVVLWHSTAYYISDPLKNHGSLEKTLDAIKAELGGTVMGSVADLLEDRRINPVVTIYLTDGQVEPKPKLPAMGGKLFIIVDRNAKDPEFVKTIKNFLGSYGEVIVTPMLE